MELTFVIIDEKTAKIILDLCGIAFGESMLDGKASQLGKRLRDIYFPKEYGWIWKIEEKE